ASVNICTKGSIQCGKGPGAKDSACAAPRISKPARRRSMCLSLFKSLLGWVGGSQRVGDVVLQMQPECALGVGANHGNVQALVADAVSTPGNAPQFGGQPAAHGVVVVVGQFSVEAAVENVYFGNAHGTPAVGAGLENGFLGVFIVFVFDVANNLFEHIFHGYQAGYAAMLVHHDGQVIAAATKFVQQHIQAFGFGNEHGGPYQRAQVYGRVGNGEQQVFGQQYAHDVVAVVFVYGKA